MTIKICVLDFYLTAGYAFLFVVMLTFVTIRNKFGFSWTNRLILLLYSFCYAL